MRAQNPCRLRLCLAVQGVTLICILFSTANAESGCKRGCSESDNGYLSYTPGNVYDYNFDSIMTVGLQGGVGNSDDTSLKITGNAKLFAEGNCGYTLQLGAVKVTATKENIEKKITQSIQKPIHFTMVGGKVEPELCADQGDNVYALNVKRAIISMLQAKPDATQELDIFGQCPTHTTVSKIGSAEVVNKVRNLNACAYRKTINSGILTNALQTKPDLDGSSILKADYSKESKIENGVVANVQVIEEYTYADIPKTELGARAKVVTNLKLKNSAGAAAAAPTTGERSVSIMFQQPETYTSKNIATLKSSLTELVQLLEGYVKKDSAKNFMELIRLMRNSDTETLLELAAFPLPNNVLARQVYLDALFRTATSESARAIIKQFNKMNEKEKIIAMLSLNLVQTVDKDTLNLAASLLNANAVKEVYLAVGSLVSKYCQRNGCSNGEVDAISKKFTESLKHCKPATKKDEERILFILKGIGNTHHLASGVASSLTECVAQGRANRMRVAALQAFAAAKCDANLQKKALELLKDRNEDAELRIEAYLAAIQCPSGELANEIAEIVNTETVNQVGGFITSSLKAIRDSTDEEKELQRYHLGNVRITKKFPINLKRFSFHDEVSYKMPAWGLGASADYKLIYAQNGFLPRSARLQVKGEEFGMNLNILEASVRQENVENILEYIVGPKGLVNKDLGEILSKVDDVTGQRSRRSIADDTAKVAKKYKTYGAKNINDLNLDFSFKLFGSELLFLSLGDNIPQTFDDIAQDVSEAFERVKRELLDYNKDFTSHNYFMDSEIVYPTSGGIPMELSMEGFMANKLEFGLAVDVEALMQSNWQHNKYRLKLVPSFELNVQLKINFNAQVVSTGLQSVFSLHSASGSSMELMFNQEAESFDLKLELPREKLELVNMKMFNEFYIAEQDKLKKSVALKGAKLQDPQEPAVKSCYNQFESLGFTPCVTANFAEDQQESSLLPTFDLAVYVLTQRQINLKGSHKAQPELGLHSWKLLYSTPGSQESHDTSLTVELGTKPRTYARASVDNVRYHLAVEAGLNNDDRELVYYVQYEQDKETQKSKLGFIKNGNEYRPIIEIQDFKGGVSNEINGYHVDGRVLVQNSGDLKRLNFENLLVANKENERLILNGWADLSATFVNSELLLTVKEDTYFIKSLVKLNNGEYAVALFLNDEKQKDNIYGASAELKLQEQLIDLELTTKYGKWELSNSNHIEYNKPEGSSTPNSSKFSSSLAVKNKQQNVASLQIEGLTEAPHKFELQVKGSSAKTQTSLAIKYSAQEKTDKDYQLSINAKLNQHFIDLKSKCDMSGNHYVLDNVLTTSWGTTFTVKGEIGQRFSAQDIFIDLQGNCQWNVKDKNVIWILKIMGSPEKTTSELKVSRDTHELLRLTAETQHPQDKITSAKVNMLVKNVFMAKGDLKLNKNGKGEVTVLVETLKTEPKHKLEINSKFLMQTNKYDVEADITWDGEKMCSIKTENQIDKLKIQSKNVLEIEQKKYLLDMNSAMKGDWRVNGELQAAFTASGPTGRSITGSLKRKINTNQKTGLSQGYMEAALNDQQDGVKRSLDFNIKLEKYNTKTQELLANYQLNYKNFEEKSLNIQGSWKNLNKGKEKVRDLQTLVKGDLIKNPLEIQLEIEESSGKQVNFKFHGNYGDLLKAHLNGNYDLAGDKDKLQKYELQCNMELPHTSFKTWELKTKGQFLKPLTPEDVDYIMEFMVEEKAGQEQFITLNTNIKSSDKSGNFKLNLNTQQLQQPLEIEASYQHYQHHGQQPETGTIQYLFNFKHKEKFVKSTNDLMYKGKETFSNRLIISSSFEVAQNIQLELKGELIDNDSYNLKVNGKVNSELYSLDSKIYQGNHKKGVEINGQLAQGKPVTLIALYELMGRRKAKLNTELNNILDLDLKFQGEASYQTLEDFYLNAQWHSEKLKLYFYELDIRSQGKSVTLLMKNKQGEIFSGSATCVLKKENNKNILQGQGQIKYHGNLQTANFQLTRQVYDPNTDKEIGYSYNFNGNFAAKNAVSTLKLTNKEFNIKLSICEEKKQCNNVQILATNAITPQDVYTHSLLVLMDLRDIGFPYEFELQTKNTLEGFKYQYMLDTKINSNNNRQYNLLAHIQNTKAHVQLKLPSREIVVEAQQKYPSNKEVFGVYENSLEFYTDKINKPQDVSKIVARLDLSGDKNHKALNALAQLNLQHPHLRPLSIQSKLDINRDQQKLNGEIIFDIFRLPEQKIIASAQINNLNTAQGFNITSSQILRSSGLAFEYALNSHVALNTQLYEFSCGSDLSLGNTNDLKTSVFISGNKEHGEILVYALNEEVLKFTADYNKQKKLSKLNAKLQALGRKPLELNAELQPTHLKLLIKRNGLFNAQSELKLGKELKFQIVSGEKELASGRVGLDTANFLRTNYEANEENIKEFMKVLEEEMKQETQVTTELKKRFEHLKQITERQMQLSRESVPDFSQLKNSYQNSLNEIVKELEEDPAMKQISETLQNLYNNIAQLATEFSQLWNEAYGKLHKSAKAVEEKLHVLFEESIIPAWQEFTTNLETILREIRLEIVRLYGNSFKTLLEALKQYEPVLRSYAKTLAETLKPFNEVVQELYKTLAIAMEDLVNEWMEYWSKLPNFEAWQTEVKEKLSALQLGEKSLEFVNNIFEQLHVLPLTSEISEFLHKFHEYAVAKLKHEQVDDEKLVEDLVKLFIKAVRSVLVSLELSAPAAAGISGLSLNELFSVSPLTADWFNEFPALLTFRFSVLNFLLNEDWDNWITKEDLKSLFYFDDFQLKGHMAEGRHLFTFDGQHVHVNTGNCKYILAQDSVDNNFTVIGHLNNSKMKSIILTDREGQFMEINDAGVLKLNGNAVEYPQHENGLHAWRLYYTVYMVSEYGIQIMCTSDLKVCHVDVNGFYTSKTRGLLGNGNAEPYDDFVQIDGSVASDTTTFVNGYGLGKCPSATASLDAQVSEENDQRSEICNELFGYESSLAVGYLFINSQPYRQACDQSVHDAADKDKESAACTIATAYASALKMQDVFVFLPKRCLKCTGSAGQREVGEEFTLKVPTNKADLVFVIDVDVPTTIMSNLIAPVVTEVRETLKSRGFTDVQIGVVAYSANQRYPAILTSDNGKLNYQGNVAEIKLNGPKPLFETSVSQMFTEKKLLDVFDFLESIVKSIVAQPDELAFRLALNYPFRAGAAKSVVAVRSNNLEYDNMLKFVRAHLIGAVTQFDAALLHVIGPVKDMSLEGVSPEKLVGFNSRLVATLDGKDAKKRPKLQFHNDMGIDFVLNNGGWVFATQNFDQLKPEGQKKALNQITTSLADTLYKTEIVADCRCLPVHGIHAQHKCVIKSSNFVPNKKIKA